MSVMDTGMRIIIISGRGTLKRLIIATRRGGNDLSRRFEFVWRKKKNHIYLCAIFVLTIYALRGRHDVSLLYVMVIFMRIINKIGK